MFSLVFLSLLRITTTTNAALVRVQKPPTRTQTNCKPACPSLSVPSECGYVGTAKDLMMMTTTTTSPPPNEKRRVLLASGSSLKSLKSRRRRSSSFKGRWWWRQISRTIATVCASFERVHRRVESEFAILERTRRGETTLRFVDVRLREKLLAGR